MMKLRICLLALPLLSTAACLDTSDQDSADGTSSQALAARAAASICESHGSFCVGAPSLAFEAPVVETASGRNFLLVATPTGFNLAFSADPTRCVAVKDNGASVEVRACTMAGANAVWIIETGPDGHSCVFQSRVGGFLSGHNDGGQFTVEGIRASGAFQQFTVPGFCG
ncbi:MAG TPA: hypothetical protein VHW23_21705 [Kofleriaceae bacterium]|jgi:hypothetical protein|nr:hypothetical protein [Kofleriaceae bacterium]